MTSWYCSMSSKVQSLGAGSGCAARPLDGTGSCRAARRLRRPPYSLSMGLSPTLRKLSPRVIEVPSRGRTLFLEQLAEHRVDLGSLGDLAHREVRLHFHEL